FAAKRGTATWSVRWRTQGWFVGFAAEKSPVGAPRAERVELGVLVFLKRAHGSPAAGDAKRNFYCGLRSGGERESGRAGERERFKYLSPCLPVSLSPSVSRSPALPLSRSLPPNPQSVKVRSVSENVTPELPL